MGDSFLIILSSLVGEFAFFEVSSFVFPTGVSGIVSLIFDEEGTAVAFAASLLAGVAVGSLSSICRYNDETAFLKAGFQIHVVVPVARIVSVA